MISPAKCKDQPMKKFLTTRDPSHVTSGSSDLHSGVSLVLITWKKCECLPVTLNGPTDEQSRKNGDGKSESTVNDGAPQDDPSLLHKGGE